MRIRIFLRVFEYQSYHKFFKSIFDMRLTTLKKLQDVQVVEQDKRSEIDLVKHQDLMTMQYVYVVFANVMQMVIFCWVLSMIFSYILHYINETPESSAGTLPGSCLDKEGFLHFDFKDEGSCLDQKGQIDQILVYFYFICTTLSTVGFGDLRPVTDKERLEIIPYLLFG